MVKISHIASAPKIPTCKALMSALDDRSIKNRIYSLTAFRSLLTLPKALIADHLTIIIIEVLLPNVDIEKFTNNYQAVTSMWLVPLINTYIATYIQLLPICPIRADR
jgi:hypothetical protein